MENISKEAELDNFKHQSYERMAATYPLIYRAYLHPDQYPAYPIAERKFECGLGWYDIIDELSAWLEGQAEHFQQIGSPKIPLVAQCKEKFGSLRYYVREFPDNQAFRDELAIRKETAYQRSCCTSEI
jgi:hypothetical protein